MAAAFPRLMKRENEILLHMCPYVDKNLSNHEVDLWEEMIRALMLKELVITMPGKRDYIWW